MNRGIKSGSNGLVLDTDGVTAASTSANKGLEEVDNNDPPVEVSEEVPTDQLVASSASKQFSLFSLLILCIVYLL